MEILYLKNYIKKNFQESLLKSTSLLDVFDKNIIFMNFIDYKNEVNSIRIELLQLVKLYDKKVNIMLTKLFK